MVTAWDTCRMMKWWWQDDGMMIARSSWRVNSCGYSGWFETPQIHRPQIQIDQATMDQQAVFHQIVSKFWGHFRGSSRSCCVCRSSVSFSAWMAFWLGVDLTGGFKIKILQSKLQSTEPDGNVKRPVYSVHASNVYPPRKYNPKCGGKFLDFLVQIVSILV